MKAYYDMARLIAEIALTKPDQDVSDARAEVQAARKKGKMAARAMQMNPNNPRYKNDLADANKRLKKAKSKASEPMTHEKDPNF